MTKFTVTFEESYEKKVCKVNGWQYIVLRGFESPNFVVKSRRGTTGHLLIRIHLRRTNLTESVNFCLLSILTSNCKPDSMDPRPVQIEEGALERCTDQIRRNVVPPKFYRLKIVSSSEEGPTYEVLYVLLRRPKEQYQSLQDFTVKTVRDNSFSVSG